MRRMSHFAWLYAFLVIAWSSSYSVVKVGLAYSPPLFFAGLRTLLGGLLLLWPAWFWNGGVPLRRMLSPWLWTALFLSVLFPGSMTYALYYLPSGLSSVLIYLQPILVGVLAHFWLGERLTWNKTVGLVLGFFGVLVVGWEGVAGSLSLAGIVLGLAAAAGWAVGTVYVRRVQHRVPLLWLMAGQMAIGGGVLLALSGFSENWDQVTWNASFLAVLLYSSAVSMAGAWVIYFVLMERGEASRVAANTFLVPLVSVLFGVLFLHETVHWFLAFGGGLIVIGIFVANRQFSRSGRSSRPVGKLMFDKNQ